MSVYSAYNGGPNNYYTTSTLNNGDIVYATVRHSHVSNPCGFKDTSNSIVMSVISVLPISLSKFSVIAPNNKFMLNWTTASEMNAAYFNVQQSLNGNDFTNIGKVAAVGNFTTLQAYSLVTYLYLQ